MNTSLRTALGYLAILCLIPLLANCSRGKDPAPAKVFTASGEVALEGGSFDGAEASISALEQGATLESVRTGTYRVEGIKPVSVNSNGAFSLSGAEGLVNQDKLYVVEIACETISEDCNVRTPLHVVLTGEQLLEPFQVSVLTELAYQTLSYYVVAEYSAEDMQQMMNGLAKTALKNSADTNSNGTIDYVDLLEWNPASDDQLYRPTQVGQTGNAMMAGVLSLADFRSFTGTVFNPVIGSVGGFNARSVTVAGDYAYVAADVEVVGEDDRPTTESRLYLIDITEPTAPSSVGYVATGGKRSNHVALSGHHAYISTNAGMEIIDVSQPASPVRTGGITGEARSVALSGHYAYAVGSTGLRAIIVSNPANPVQVGLLAGDFSGLAVNGSLAYVAGAIGLQSINIENPALPVGVGRLDIALTSFDVKLCGRYAYLNNAKLVVDISNPEAPVQVSDVAADRCVADGELQYQAAGSSGFQVAVPYQEGSLDDARVFSAYVSSDLKRIEFGDRFLYMMGQNTLQIFDLRNAGQPLRAGHLSIEDNDAYYKGTSQIVLGEGYIYAAHDGGSSGEYVSVIDVQNPDSPFLAYTIMRTPSDAKGIAVRGDYLYVAEFLGLDIFDISDPTNPTFVSSIWDFVDSWDETYALAVSGYYAYVGLTYDDGLQVIDIRDPTHPVRVGQVETSFQVDDSLATNGRYAYHRSYWGSALTVFDILDPVRPRIVTDVSLAVALGEKGVKHGNYLYVPSGAGVDIYDVSEPESPVLFVHAKTQGTAYKLNIQDNFVYVATSYGIEALKVIPEAAPSTTSTSIH